MAYSNFAFDKPAKVAGVGVLDQNVEVPDSLQRAAGNPSTHVSRGGWVGCWDAITVRNRP